MAELTKALQAAQAARKAKLAARDPNAPKETKRARFIRLANSRLPKAVGSVEKLANLFTSGYDWTEEDHAKTVEVLDRAVEVVRMAARGKSKTTVTFFS